MPSELVPTGIAAKAIGVDRATLVRWWNDGDVTPELVTPGGHARWKIDDLLQQFPRQPRTRRIAAPANRDRNATRYGEHCRVDLYRVKSGAQARRAPARQG